LDNEITHVYNDENDVWDVKLTGEFDIFNSSVLKDALNTIIGEKKASLCIDCESLHYMDSTSIGVLVSVLKNVKTYDGAVALKNLKPNLVKLFRITNLNKVFEIEGEADE